MSKQKMLDYLAEMPYASIGDGERARETMDFFYELDGVEVAKSKGSDKKFVWNWIEEFSNFFKNRKWKYVNKQSAPYYFVAGEQCEDYSPKEMKEWVDSICSDGIFINVLKLSMDDQRKEKFLSDKNIPEDIKIAVYPNLYR